ncbi:uncharacterized protein F5891DRAFT_965601, partial [Suillus fuscotomentosus]
HPSISAMFVKNVVKSLRNRFQQWNIMSDLDEAIERHRAALFRRPPGHSDRSSSLNKLAIGLRERFQQWGMMSDLDEAIELHRTALLLYPPGHSDRSSSLNNLAASLRNRFQQRGMMSDLDEAIELHRAALLLHPPGHSDRSMSLNNFAISLQDRFQQRGMMSDLDEAIELHRAALLLRPSGHSLQSNSLNNLALSLKDRFQKQGVQSDLEEAFSVYFQLSCLSHAVSRTHLNAAKSWAASTDIFNHPSALLAYKIALKSLDQQVALLSSSSHHFNVIRGAVSSLATDAFACSVCHGALTTAVELVEQDRAVFWTQLARFNTSLNELSVSGMVLAEEFKRLSVLLRNTFDQSEDQSPQIRQLTMQWDEVVSRICLLPDISRFLLPPLFSGLQKAAGDGPVIIINAGQRSCDTLIIHSAGDPVHVPLDITQAEFGSSDYQLTLVGILRKLWNDVIDPIVQALKESQVRPGSRIWWCSTAEFTLLPLHAAGPYEKGRDNFSDIYISSSTPTLATLVRARQQVCRDTSSQHFVAIGQGNPVEGKELKCVTPELAVIARHVTPVISFTSLRMATQQSRVHLMHLTVINGSILPAMECRIGRSRLSLPSPCVTGP